MNASKLFAIALATATLSLPGLATASWFADPEAGSPQVDLIATPTAAAVTRAQVVSSIPAVGSMPATSSAFFADPEAGSPQVDLISRLMPGSVTRAKVISGIAPAGSMAATSSAWFADPEAGLPQVDRIDRLAS